jgi:hypothetical protein
MARAATVLKEVEAPPEAVMPETITKHIQVTVRGVRPLMTHNPATMGTAPASGKGEQSRIPKPEDEAEAGTYRLEDGTCAIKGESFARATVSAASQWKIKRGTATRLVAHILVLEELVPLQRHDGSMISDYVIDTRRVRIQRAGILRSRPRYNEWQATFTVEYDPALISDPAMLIGIMSDGINRFGVGDARPGCNMSFGRARIIDWKPLD